MERKIGEVFTYNSKIYQVIKANACRNCAFKVRLCEAIESITGTCIPGKRTDNTSVSFKLINNMEIKNNQLTIDIPEGMEIDLENSNLAKGIVKFKQSTITYEDALKLCIHHKDIIVNESSASKLINLNKLMNIAKYYNRDWEPNWNTSKCNTYRESKYYIYYENSENKYGVGYTTDINWGNVYFKSRDDAKSVIDNPNFRTILDEIYKD